MDGNTKIYVTLARLGVTAGLDGPHSFAARAMRVLKRAYPHLPREELGELYPFAEAAHELATASERLTRARWGLECEAREAWAKNVSSKASLASLSIRDPSTPVVADEWAQRKLADAMAYTQKLAAEEKKAKEEHGRRWRELESMFRGAFRWAMSVSRRDFPEPDLLREIERSERELEREDAEWEENGPTP